MRERSPNRKTLPHAVPPWARGDDLYFITICAQPKGENQLCRPAPGSALLDTVAVYRAQEKWYPLIFLLMPDHVHMLAAFAEVPGMRASVSAWKRYTARQLGIRWQRDFFDHRIRSHESAEEKLDYIRKNPVREGLVDRPEDWPWVMMSDDLR